MSTKTRKPRLQPQTTFDQLTDAVYDGYEQKIEFRARDSGDGPWTLLKGDRYTHPYNLEKFNYRPYQEPRIYRKGARVHTSEGYQTLKAAQAIVALCRKAKRAKNHTRYDFAAGDDGNPSSFDLNIYANGDVSVGCEEFTFEEIQEFAQSQGW